ncbi:SMP-30/gluconolactonase/LRE family protein [Massilia terrae]|uniref:SMP-30/gluconolactonase/LRE family protein n=1 Tax=Massilia terrae TaxID=1811224 RepID=A0ABT2CTA0_9BURK|nr:SMP-30/gluconolactonase/LRE family protein [Massilia terrae]MCS0657210.1 SMP-30/gluconolactonase/LRE family protein [Massilia terrae]
MRELQAECLWPVGAELGEGPLWVPEQERIYFVDIKSSRLHALCTGSGQRFSWSLPDFVCWVVPRRDGDGFMAGLRREVVRLWLEPELRIEPLALPLELGEHVRLNDAKADAHGNLWFGSMNNADVHRPDGRLFHLRRDHTLSVQDQSIHICNGPTFSLDGGTMYHTDSLLAQVSAYPIGPDGATGAAQPWRRFDDAVEGSPDGMTTDSEGAIWIAQWGGGRVCRYAPDGTLDTIVRVPVSQPSSCAFGGPDLKTLYITSARQDLGQDQLAAEPLAGALFAVPVDVAGLPAARFG